MSASQYLIKTSVGGRTRTSFWSGEHELLLDESSPWTLFFDEGRLLKLKDKESTPQEKKFFDLSQQDVEKGFLFRLPKVKTAEGIREVEVFVTKIKAVTPAYLPLPAKGKRGVVLSNAVFYVHAGVHDFIFKSRRIGRAHGARIAGKTIFVFGKIDNSYKLKSHTPYLILEKADGTTQTFHPGETRFIDAEVFENCTLYYGNFWWRFNYANQPPMLSGLLYESQEVSESVWFRRATKSLIAFMLVAAVLANFTKTWRHREKKETAPPQVTWKQPKLLPAPVIPKPVEKPPEPPKPKPKPPEPKPETKPKPKPPERKTPPKPTPVKTPPPKKVATPPPPTAAPKPPAPTPQADLAKSLSFLSNPKTKAPAPLFTTSANNKYKNSISPAPEPKNSTLRDLSAKEKPEVDLKNAREITSEANVKGKQLSDVKGKVSLDPSLAESAKGNLGSALGKGGALSVSGAGSISEEALKKALSKNLAKFQYCYEKALLSDPSISGVVTLEWAISTDGKASGAKILNSQIASTTLQNCLKTEISKTAFPKPQGGEVTVKYPFSFTSGG